VQDARKWYSEPENGGKDTHDDHTNGSSTSRAEVKATRVEELILGRLSNNLKIVDSTVTKEWKWLFVNGIHKVYVRQLKRFIIFL
jgi:hypothetical protein